MIFKRTYAIVKPSEEVEAEMAKDLEYLGKTPVSKTSPEPEQELSEEEMIEMFEYLVSWEAVFFKGSLRIDDFHHTDTRSSIFTSELSKITRELIEEMGKKVKDCEYKCLLEVNPSLIISDVKIHSITRLDE